MPGASFLSYPILLREKTKKTPARRRRKINQKIVSVNLLYARIKKRKEGQKGMHVSPITFKHITRLSSCLFLSHTYIDTHIQVR